MTSNKALLKSVVTPPPTGDIEAHATGPQTNGWFTGTVAVTISGAPDIEYSLDGAHVHARHVALRERDRHPLAGLPGK